MTFYAENDSREIINDPSRHGEEVEIGGLDLWRFDTKKERDDFVEDGDYATIILARQARENHPDQFKYWLNNK